MIVDGGPDQTHVNASPALYRSHDGKIYPQEIFNLWFSADVSKSPGAAASASKQLAIDDESGALGELVVKPLRGVIGLMRLPVDARRPGQTRVLIDFADEGAADPLSAR